ncbi:MAG: penicillin-binding protein [Cryobacterium sp.]|nr:penicillin-binding protein [Oligoflexia bacterium]
MIRRRNIFAVATIGLTALVAFSVYWTKETWIAPVATTLNLKPEISKENIALALAEKGVVKELPKELVLNLKGRLYPVNVEYATHPGMTEEMMGLLNQYKPDYGAFVAVDATTGRILTMISYSQDDVWMQKNLALRATFPSASVFKVVTAAAAISERKMSAGSIVSFNGRPHTLYRKNIFKETTNRWTTHLTLKDAFARSVNSVFGKLGVFIVGPTELKSYAQKFGFNRKLPSDIPVEEGRAEITEDPWEIAEAASGYTKHNTMSPLQGALIAAAIANDGKLMEPYIVENLKNAEGELVYQGGPRLSNVVIDAQAAEEMKILMRETVSSGTSRGTFRGFKRGPQGDIDVGGKTGSLTGTDPAGKYDWFVGYGVSGEHRLAVASLVISKKYWKVKSSYLARRAIEVFFREQVGDHTLGSNRRIAAGDRSVVLSSETRSARRRARIRNRRIARELDR